jgi:hypothetical protein
MKIDWGKKVQTLFDLGGESYENRATRVAVKAGLILLFLIVVWRFLK